MTQWKVGLSNGTNFTENVVPFMVIEGELKPWKRLVKYVEENNLEITSLCLTDGKKTFNLPSGGNRPKFRAFQELEKPIGFNHFQMIGGHVNGGDQQLFTVIEAIYSNKKLQLWVDEQNTDNCWVLVV